MILRKQGYCVDVETLLIAKGGAKIRSSRKRRHSRVMRCKDTDLQLKDLSEQHKDTQSSSEEFFTDLRGRDCER